MPRPQFMPSSNHTWQSRYTVPLIPFLCVQLCVLLGALIPGFEETCNAFMEAQLPAIIEGIVENNLNPQDVCLAIGFCP